MQGHSSARILPKNLFFSAQTALSEEAIRSGNVTHSNVRDLCTLINVASLYDTVETLGNQLELDPRNKPHIADGYAKIRDLTGLQVKIGPEPSEFEDVLRTSLFLASEPFVRKGLRVDQQGLEDRLRKSLRAETSSLPDYWADFAEGRQALLANSPGEKTIKAEDYWLRSFLYAGLALARKRPFVPDAARSWGMDSLVDGPHDYGQQLETVIQWKYPPDRMRELITDSPFPMPPLAAAVFLRAGKDFTRIAVELKALREEMEPVRKTLEQFQLESETADYRGLLTLFGQAHTDESRHALDERHRAALDVLRKVKIPVPPQFLVIKPAYDLLKSGSDILNPAASGLSALKDTFEFASHIQEASSHRTETGFAEVHCGVGWTLRALFNDPIRLESLFGTIQDDGPPT